MWRSLVAHYAGGVGVAGSNPVAPTNLRAVGRFLALKIAEKVLWVAHGVALENV